MPYELGDDEIAFIMKPLSFDADGEWTGRLATGVAVGDNITLSEDTIKDVVALATLISSFLDVVEDDDYIRNKVTEHRDQLLEEHLSNYMSEEEPEPVYETDQGSNVIRLTRNTKTKGNA